MSAEVKESGSHVTVTNFAGRAHIALNDKPLRANFRRAMDGLMSKRAAQFPDAGDLARLRSRGAAIKERANLSTRASSSA